jgi:hypothetical protein
LETTPTHGWGIHVLRCIKLHIGLIVGNSEEKETASVPRHRRENIKLHLKGIGCEGMDWMILHILYNQQDAS